MKGLATFVVCLLVYGCGKTNPYKCTGTDQCVRNGEAGTCEAQGYCSFPDPACQSGNRFESGAGDGLGGQCTTLVPPDAAIPPCGHLGEACCAAEQGSACVGATYCNAGTCDECVSQIAFGHDQGCFLKKDHTLWCSGRDSSGELGDGTGSSVPYTSPVQVVDAAGPITDATAVAFGYSHGCAVRTGGTVFCWGRNYNGQLGNNTTTTSLLAIQALQAAGSGTAPLTGITAVEATGSATCARDTTGVVYCWGYNGSGNLADGTTTTRHVAAPIMAGSGGFPGADSFVGGDGHFCAKSGSSAWCWGEGGDYELGTGSNANATTPVKLADTPSVGVGNYHTCWVNADTTVSCVGANWHGQMGNGSGNDFTGADQQTAAQVITDAGTPFTGAAEVVGGGAMTCARTSDGHVYCWGDNKYGQIGGGSPTPTPLPVLDAGTGMPLEHADRLVAKYAHVCAHTSDAGWKCWGRGGQGELGDGKQRSRGMATPLGVTCP